MALQPHELWDRVDAFVLRGEWSAAAGDLDQILAGRPMSPLALYLRARAFDAADSPLEATFLLGAAIGAYSEDEELLHPDDVNTVRDARTRLPDLRDRALRRAPELDAEARARLAAWVSERIDAWARRGDVAILEGAERALTGVDSHLEELLVVLSERRHAARALQAAYDQAVIAASRTPREGARLLELLLPRVRERPEVGAVTEATVLRALGNAMYRDRDYRRAADIGERLVAIDPNDVNAWLLRANGHLFARDHEAAAAAFDEAFSVMRRVYAPMDARGAGPIDDLRPTAYFNHACVLAKLGRRDAALASLREAIARDPKWAGEAARDDYFASLVGDPEFSALVGHKPRRVRRARGRRPSVRVDEDESPLVRDVRAWVEAQRAGGHADDAILERLTDVESTEPSVRALLEAIGEASMQDDGSVGAAVTGALELPLDEALARIARVLVEAYSR